MKIQSEDEIKKVFRLLGLATESDRQRFRFGEQGGEEPERQDAQIFIRVQATTATQGGNPDAQLA